MKQNCEKGLISVIMGVHNGADRLDAAIDSIIAQTYRQWEFIICDDGSNDESLMKLREYEKGDNRFRIISNNSNLGLANTLNHCIKFCRGEFIARMDDDDISYNDRFEKQVQFLNIHEDISFISSAADIYNGEKTIGVLRRKLYPTKLSLIWNSQFVHPATLFRANDLKKVNGYRVSNETRRGQDYDLFMRLYGAGFKGANLQTPVFRYTINSNNLKKRTFEARKGEVEIRKYGYKAMGVMPWAAPMILKPYLAYIFGEIKYRRMKRDA